MSFLNAIVDFVMTPQHFAWLLVLLVGVSVLTVVPVMLMVERWGSAWLQRRSGPNRVGPFGTMQPMADALKLVFKEENIPAKAHKILFMLAPAVAVFPPLIAFAVIPLAGSIVFRGQEFPIQIAMLDTGLLFVLAITSFARLLGADGRLEQQQQICVDGCPAR